MILHYLMNYMLVDFLLDQKEHIERLEKQIAKIKDKERKKILRIEVQTYYERGLDACSRYQYDLPPSIKDYFLKAKVLPSFKNMQEEFILKERLHEKMLYSFKIKLIEMVAVMASVIAILIILFIL